MSASSDKAAPSGGTPDLANLRQKRDGELQRRWVTDLISRKRNVSSIELSLTAITVAIYVLKVTLTELGQQIGALVGGTEAIQVLDASVAVGFVAIAIAALQIPRQFTETLIYSNQDALRLLALLGATQKFVAACFRRVILRAMMRATVMGLTISAAGYLAFSHIFNLWVPATLNAFLVDVGTSALIIVGFMAVVSYLVRFKINRLFADQGY